MISNTFDFEVRLVIHNGRRMRGVFARRGIETGETPAFIGVYPGRRKNETEMERKAAQYAARHGVDLRTASRKTNAYVLSLERVDPGYSLDPTGEDGELLPEYAAGIVCYLNENPPGCVPKATFVYNLPRSRYEVWLQQEAAQDEEIFLFYGKQYFRDYPVDIEAGESRYYYLIPAESVLAEDPRGIPAPLQLPACDGVSIAEEGAKDSGTGSNSA